MKFTNGFAWKFKASVFLGSCGLLGYKCTDYTSYSEQPEGRIKKYFKNADVYKAKCNDRSLNPENQNLHSSRIQLFRNKFSAMKISDKLCSIFGLHQTCQADGVQNKVQYDPNFKTDVYVWGNGVLLNNIMNYSNFSPKKIRNFSKEGDPVIISVKFGLFHEAYLDTEGKAHICQKYKLPSQKRDDMEDCTRTILRVLEIEGEQLTQIEFTKNRIFGLTSSGEVYVWIINISEPVVSKETSFEDMIFRSQPEEPTGVINTQPYHIKVKELRNITSIKTGEDHFLALDSAGVVWAMGSDKYGQCGQFRDGRPCIPPFKEVRIGKPQKINIQEKISKISAGKRHSLAITEYGRLFGWGYNHQVQLSHGDNLASVSSQKLAIFEPTSITNNIPTLRVLNVDGGEDFTIIVGVNEKGIQEVWGTGNNLKGQLGLGTTTHFHDMEKTVFQNEFLNPVNFKHLSCGRRHTILAVEQGGLFVWGDNEFGQLGNKKRRICDNPLIRPQFSRGLKIFSVECDGDSSAVIVERPIKVPKVKELLKEDSNHSEKQDSDS